MGREEMSTTGADLIEAGQGVHIPISSRGDMKLTNAHRRALKYYQRLHGTRPTLLSLLALVWWRYLLVMVMAAIVVLILPTALNFLLAGFVLGMIIRDLQRFWHWARLWPMYEKILSWDEIEALLADDP